MTPSSRRQTTFAPPSTQALLILWLVVCLFFATWPQIDLIVARQFYNPETNHWPVADSALLQQLRETFWLGLNLMALGLLAMTLQGVFTRRAMQIPLRIWAYGLTLVLLGPGLLVNLVLKSHWGRARPAQLEIFGGSAQFTPPLQITDQCASNCSFVSGEAAFTVTGIIIVGLLLWHVVPQHRRRWLLGVLITIALTVASLRVMKGRHFLSDVVWSFVLMTTMATLLARLFRLRSIHHLVTADAFRADLATLREELRSHSQILITFVIHLKRPASICFERISQAFMRSLHHERPANIERSVSSEDP